MAETGLAAGDGLPDGERQRLYRQANALALFTIYYNLLEGLISVWFGIADDTLTLFGFGVDSFIEVLSAVGVWHMLRRIRNNGGASRDEFEQRALRITGSAFYLLSAGLVLTVIVNISQNHRPETTWIGAAISAVSISFMWLLIHYKTKIGTLLGSQAMLADAACARACIYLSLVLLAASLGYELTGIGFLDSLGALFIAWLTWKEGRESFQKAAGMGCGCSCGCG